MKSVFLLLFTLAATAMPSRCEDPPSLKSAVANRYRTGVGLSLKSLTTPANGELLLTHFDTVTPENCMKFASVQPAEGDFRFDDPDRFVEASLKHDLSIVGHCLIWAKDDRTPDWFFRDGDTEVTAEVLQERMKTHIRMVMTRYRGKIDSWDVVNEALSDDGDYLRDSTWAKLLSDDFIVDAFRLAHEIDPEATLIYNDYLLYRPDKLKRLKILVDRLEKAGVPLHAVGIQGHFIVDEVPYAEVEALLKFLRERNLKIAVSELDLDMVPRGIWWADDGSRREEARMIDPYTDGLPAELQKRQAEQYARLFDLFSRYEDVILRVSFWNLHDGESWLNYFPWDRTNHPLLFDRERRPKPAFEAVIKALLSN